VADIPAKGDQDGQKSAEMEQDFKGDAGVFNAEEMAEEHQVAGAGNRQKLGQSLYDPEYDRIEQRHCASRHPIGVISGPALGR